MKENKQLEKMAYSKFRSIGIYASRELAKAKKGIVNSRSLSKHQY